jgi:hypothetical protein
MATPWIPIPIIHSKRTTDETQARQSTYQLTQLVDWIGELDVTQVAFRVSATKRSAMRIWPQIVKHVAHPALPEEMQKGT